MSTGTDISALYREFSDALTEVLAENAIGPARRGRLARARAAVKKHPEYTEHAYFAQAAKAATTTIPIVFGVGEDAVHGEFVNPRINASARAVL
jgi:hypothetical protein